MERGPQEVARGVTGEDPPRPVPAVGGRRQPEQQDPGIRIAEARHRPAPVRLVAEPGDLLARDLLAPRDEPRAAAAGHDLRGQRGEGRPVGHASPAAAYLSRSLSIRREVIARPTMPMIDRYATWTSRTGEIAPTVSERIRSTPW